MITAVMAAACSNSPDDFASPWYPDAPIEEITAGDGWALELVRPDGITACFQIRVGDRATRCSSWESGLVGSSSSGLFQGPHMSFAHVTAGGDQPLTFLWFSSLHDGLEVDGYPLDGSLLAIVELADDEEPWGMQILGADGSLVSAVSFVDRG